MAEISTAGTSESKVKFWGILAVIILVFSITILLVDMGIKTAIVQESNNLKLFIERHTNGQTTAGSDESGDSSNAGDNSPLPGDVLAFNPAGMEARNVRERTKARPSNRRPAGRGDAPIPPEGSA